MQGFITFILIVAIVHYLRNFLANRVTSAPQPEAFAGELYLIDGSYVAKRNCTVTPTRTIICFPGFLEDMRYFLELYTDETIELILINNANYHCPFVVSDIRALPASATNPHRQGTIAYDAHIVNRVNRQLATTGAVTLHGHSRGGAVVLEAGKQAPGLASRCDALLEAPVVPKGKLSRGNRQLLRYGGFYLAPFIFSVMRILPTSLLFKSPLMKISTPYKAKMFSSLPFVPRQFATAVINMRDIQRWQARNDFTLYENFRSVTMYVGERDGVLSRNAMLHSARQSQQVRVIETEGTNHFITLERPELIRSATV